MPYSDTAIKLRCIIGCAKVDAMARIVAEAIQQRAGIKRRATDNASSFQDYGKYGERFLH